MVKELTPEFAIKWTKFSTGFLFTWPPRSKATRLTKISYQIGWWSSWILAVLLVIPLLYSIYKKRNSLMQLTESLSLAIATTQVIVKMMIAKRYYYQYQVLIEKIETFVKNANFYERGVLMDFVKRIAPYHFTYNVICFLACLIYAFIPLIMHQPFPSIADYPFSVDQHPAYDIVYFSRVIGAYQCGCTGSLNCQLSLFLWYWAIQLKFLAEKIGNASSGQELIECICMHQYLLRSINETIKIVQPIVITTLVMATITIACGGIHVVGDVPVIKRIFFVNIDIGYALELLCVAWATENLTTACEEVGWMLYYSPLIQQSKEFKKIAIIVMQRCQKPPVLGIGGFLPKLSLNYYAAYMSATYSFFTTLHVTLKKFENHQ